MKIFGLSDPGIQRKRNEDNYFYRSFDKGYAVVAVADGMGGHAAGEVASSIAIDVLSRFTQSEEMPDIMGEVNAGDFPDLVAGLIKEANEEIFKAARQDNQKSGMGTTFTVGFILKNRLIIGHVGDSRAYQLSLGIMEKLTKDHTLVEEMLKDGRIKKDELKNHPRRHMLTKALGTSAVVEVDIESIPLHEGDSLLFCTDGLTSLVKEEEIKQVILDKGDNPGKAVDFLISLANNRGGFDNVTLVLVTGIGEV